VNIGCQGIPLLRTVAGFGAASAVGVRASSCRHRSVRQGRTSYRNHDGAERAIADPRSPPLRTGRLIRQMRSTASEEAKRGRMDSAGGGARGGCPPGSAETHGPPIETAAGGRASVHCEVPRAARTVDAYSRSSYGDADRHPSDQAVVPCRTPRSRGAGLGGAEKSTKVGSTAELVGPAAPSTRKIGGAC
jgi:hypothetical protein